MKVKVILTENIKGVGKKDEIIEVKDGYANNFLYKMKKAIPATTENINKLKNRELKKEKNHEKDIKVANEIKKEIESQEIILHVKAGDNGKVFGSLGAKEISDEIYKIFNVEIDKKKISNDARIKTIGIHDVEIKLHQEVKAIIKVNVKDIN